MLGRMRPSSSSLECLELERSPPKIVKHDSLSIYEETLVKLRQGSQRDLLSSSEHRIEIDVNCRSASNSPYEEAMTTYSKEQPNKTMSVIHLFARYKSSQQALSSLDEAAVIKYNCSSASSSPSARTVDR